MALNATNMTVNVTEAPGSLADILSGAGYMDALVLFSSFFFAAWIIDFVLKRYGEKITVKTGSDLVGEMFKIIHKPVYWILIVTGLLLAIVSIPVNGVVETWTKRIMFIFHSLMLAYILSRVSYVLVNSWIKVTKRYEKTPQLINKIISIIIYVIALLIILDSFEIEISPIIATLGVGGIAVGLALQDTLKDFFAGLHIISDQPIKVGDYIQLEGAATMEGYVQDIGWRSTRIKTLLDNYVVLPNSKLAASTIMNNSMPTRRMYILVDVGVDYGSDLEKVEKVAMKVAKEVQKTAEGALRDFEPRIRFREFADSNINFRVVLGIEEFAQKFVVQTAFIKALHKAFKKEGIEISWPIRKIYDMGKPKK